MTAEREVLDRWWREFAASGRPPSDLVLVQSRLIRSVHRGALPDGEVFVKTMTFPRQKDRLRYLLRPLPAAHEAAVLRRTAAAGIPCPVVVDVRLARRFGLPFRSWLVLRALPVAVRGEDPLGLLRDAAALAGRLLAAGIEHRDLHVGNFVRLEGGGLAVLDMQSVRLHAGNAADRARRVAAAARLVRDEAAGPAVVDALLAAGLVRDDREVGEALRHAARERAAYLRRRVLRCLGETTEFTRTVRWSGVEYRHRGALPPGRWVRGGRAMRRSWVGQRALALFGSRSPLFPAYFEKWWWLGGSARMYVPDACTEDRIATELAVAAEGYSLAAPGAEWTNEPTVG